MFGRVRAAPSSSSSSSSSSLEWCLELELERPPSKIIKDDSLSIYEITLNKLRLGSKRALQSSPGEETNSSLSATEAMKIDVPCCATTSSSPGEETNSSLPATETEAMKIDVPCATTASTSPSSNGDQSINICKQQMEDNSCNPPPPPPVFKYKRWPWTHSNVLSLNPESHQLFGHKS